MAITELITVSDTNETPINIQVSSNYVYYYCYYSVPGKIVAVDKDTLIEVANAHITLGYINNFSVKNDNKIAVHTSITSPDRMQGKILSITYDNDLEKFVFSTISETPFYTWTKSNTNGCTCTDFFGYFADDSYIRILKIIDGSMQSHSLYPSRVVALNAVNNYLFVVSIPEYEPYPMTLGAYSIGVDGTLTLIDSFNFEGLAGYNALWGFYVSPSYTTYLRDKVLSFNGVSLTDEGTLSKSYADLRGLGNNFVEAFSGTEENVLRVYSIIGAVDSVRDTYSVSNGLSICATMGMVGNNLYACRIVDTQSLSKFILT